MTCGISGIYLRSVADSLQVHLPAGRMCNCWQAVVVEYNIQTCHNLTCWNDLFFLGEPRIFGALFAASLELERWWNCRGCSNREMQFCLLGWQPRWFLLCGGILSYYDSQEDAWKGCKGSIQMAVCEIQGKSDAVTQLHKVWLISLYCILGEISGHESCLCSYLGAMYF